VREVGEGDDADAPHARGLAQHDLGVAQVLQGVDLQHHVEALVLERGQALVQVELQHVDAALHAGQHVGVVDLDAVAGAARWRARCSSRAPSPQPRSSTCEPSGTRPAMTRCMGSVSLMRSLLQCCSK
jgi:hypothetical protein